MAHLIQPLLQPCPLQDAWQELMRAHLALVAAARQAATTMAAVEANDWGVAAKRVRVTWALTPSGLLSETGDQPLTEVINQCATVERLLDAMAWVLSRAPAAELLLCHPTTSSRPKESADNDLVVEAAGERWCFEVSDVASGDADGNQKELKDLGSLGLIAREGDRWRLADPYPPGRHFLVVSPEFGARLCRPTRHLLKTGQLRYSRLNAPGQSVLLEVHRNP
ncbi:MAG: hypothetical protein FJ082_08250 [Cyanobacteria bacterium K_Offshore_surface_m2_011]|nr:hypothetical protein [Cyanobacteria bacterium K_Offshore_surface_m2_011]